MEEEEEEKEQLRRQQRQFRSTRSKIPETRVQEKLLARRQDYGPDKWAIVQRYLLHEEYSQAYVGLEMTSLANFLPKFIVDPTELETQVQDRERCRTFKALSSKNIFTFLRIRECMIFTMIPKYHEVSEQTKVFTRSSEQLGFFGNRCCSISKMIWVWLR